jgi:hypothetical protein
MADAYACLSSLRNMLKVRRQETMERMAKGMEKEDSYREHVGRCKELADTIDKITLQIKDINGGDDDENAG